MEEFDCKKCLHEKVCALWASRESQNASCFCTDGCDYFTPTLTPPNKPLTLEELREMKGQPVWTVTTGLDGSGRWELVCDVDYEDVLEMASCVDGFYAIEMDTYGSTWTAYRRPLERMKKIMRENGIMVIPSEYPGSTEKWNIQKPRDKKEEL